MAPAQKKAVDEGYTQVWIDESGCRLLPALVRTYAPSGQTPILRAHLSHDHLSVIAAITPEGKLYMRMQDHAFRSPDIVSFLKHLLRHIPGKLLILWDRLAAHRGQPVKAFLASGATKRIHLAQFPAYAPELNPTEGVWHYLKDVEMKNLCCHDLPELRRELGKARERLRHKTTVILGCIQQPGYI
jgi:transposase